MIPQLSITLTKSYTHYVGRTDAEAEAPILWPPDVKSQLIGKDLDAGKGQRAGGEGSNRG